MPKSVLVLALFLAAPTLPFPAEPARADSLACQTVNGKTVCLRGSGTLNCVTVDGETRCSATSADTQAAMVPDAEAYPLPRPIAPDLRGFLERPGVFPNHWTHPLRPDDDEPDPDPD